MEFRIAERSVLYASRRGLVLIYRTGLAWWISALVACLAAGLFAVLLAAQPGPLQQPSRLAFAITPGFRSAGRGAGAVAGTAFSVGSGLLVTNAHVTLRCSAAHLPIRIDGHPVRLRIAAEDRELDLALLRGPVGPDVPGLALSAVAHVPRNTLSLTLGYPAGGGIARDAAPYAALGTVRRATLMVHRPETGRAESFRATDRMGRSLEPTWGDGLTFFRDIGSERMRWALEVAVDHGARLQWRPCC